MNFESQPHNQEPEKQEKAPQPGEGERVPKNNLGYDYDRIIELREDLEQAQSQGQRNEIAAEIEHFQQMIDAEDKEIVPQMKFPKNENVYEIPDEDAEGLKEAA